MKKISVSTPIGKLTACIDGDPKNYPGIFVYLKRPDGVEIDLVAAEVDVETHNTRAYLYGDTSTDSYTRRYTWSESDINISV